MILIAEIGMNHFGNFEKAKALLRAAADSGADLVKFQAFEGKDVAAGGSMPAAFYDRCSLTYDENRLLIEVGREMGVDVFFSIFSESMEGLRHAQRWHKLSGRQTIAGIKKRGYLDFPRTFVSFPASHLIHAAGMVNAIPLYVSPYLVDDPDLFRLSYLRRVCRTARAIGYSDHTIGTTACELAGKEFGATVIEKHFSIDRAVEIDGTIFRDTVHSATPAEFRRMAKILKG